MTGGVGTDDDRLIDAVLASGVKIPPMPGMLVQVLALQRDDNAGPRDFAALLGRDPAMAGAIFRIIGSPVLGMRAKVETLEKAITVLGLRTTVAVVRSESLRGALGDPDLAVAMNTLWARMNAVGDLVMALARTLRMRGVQDDQAFLAGIFHDCGVALLCRRDAAYAQAFTTPDAWPDLCRLDAQHATNHAVCGMMVARNWQLPADVALAVRHHHDTNIDSLPDPARKMILLIQLANHLQALRGGGDDREWQEAWQGHVAAMCADAGSGVTELEASFR
jgi:HD-like signal output (HDOD) protein